MKPDISVIIPTLNEAASLPLTIAALNNLGENLEIIVVDGGSLDETRRLAENCQATVLTAFCGRGNQMRVGAKSAKGDILWFLHADTIPSSETVRQLKTVLKDAAVIGGNFTLCFDGDTKAAKFMTWLYPHLRKIGLLYGDSAIFVRRGVYEQAGGFKSLPLFEDLELVNRLKRVGKLSYLPATVTTSSRRFEGRSFPLTFLRWAIFQCLYWLGISPNLLAKRYYPIRAPKP